MPRGNKEKRVKRLLAAMKKEVTYPWQKTTWPPLILISWRLITIFTTMGCGREKPFW
jgi:hypothetical protein